MRASPLSLYARRSRRVRSGALDFSCPIEKDTLAAHCRVPLYKDKWNTWLVMHALSEPADAATLDAEARGIVRLWFSSAPIIPELTGGAVKVTGGVVDNIGANVGPTQEGGSAPAIPAGLEGREKGASRLTCGLPVTLHSGPYVPMIVRFIYRGDQPSITWPAWKLSPPWVRSPLNPLFRMASWCSVDADWIVDSAWTPIEGEEVPAPPTPEPLIDLPLGLGLPDFKGIGKDLGEGVKKIGWGIGLALGLGALVVIAK